MDQHETTTESNESTTAETTPTEAPPAWAEAAKASQETEDRAAQQAMPPRRFFEELPCSLTDDELRARGGELEGALAVIDTLRDEKKSAADVFKARIQLAEERVDEIRAAIRTKSEDRDVECVESFELRLGVARTIRTDTGEMIRERALRSAELQPSLPGTDTVDLKEAVRDMVDPDRNGGFTVSHGWTGEELRPAVIPGDDHDQSETDGVDEDSSAEPFDSIVEEPVDESAPAIDDPQAVLDGEVQASSGEQKLVKRAKRKSAKANGRGHA